MKSYFGNLFFYDFTPLFCSHDTIEASLLFWLGREYFCGNPTAKALQRRVTLILTRPSIPEEQF